MKERPILFSGPMVRAILDGRKTQTRRIVKPQPTWHEVRSGAECFGWKLPGPSCYTVGMVPPPCPYGVPGDRLWVREGFMPAPMEAAPAAPRATRWNVAYAAGGQAEAEAPAGYDPVLYNYERWTPSIHMPRWASRITLEIVSVRVEKLQEIDEFGALAEGAHVARDALGFSRHAGFIALWDSINAKRAPWESNPWVWVIEFKKGEG